MELRELADIKTNLFADLVPILGKDVMLVQAKIQSADSVEALMEAIGACCRILEVALSKEISQEFFDAVKRRFAT
jgi:hypothetical protein